MSNMENTTDPAVDAGFTELEFDQYLAKKMRTLWTKIEGSMNLLKNGQQIVAYEQIQGIADGVKHLVGGIERRVKQLGGNTDENS